MGVPGIEVTTGDTADDFCIVMVSPNGTEYRLVVDNDGVLSTELVT